jgi:predicted RNA-binding Zn-ribbon protein involved in translation (DUF1610 family)
MFKVGTMLKAREVRLSRKKPPYHPALIPGCVYRKPYPGLSNDRIRSREIGARRYEASAPVRPSDTHDTNRDHCANICHFPNTRFAQSSSNGSPPRQSDQTSSMRCSQWKHEMFADRITSPQCPKCGAMMLLRIIEPERPGFDSRTFECPKCYDTETVVALISREIDISVGLA